METLKPAHSDTEADLMDQIATDIQAGAYAPGSWLKQIELQQRYKTSRPMIRLALDRLAQKQLIRHELNRGYYVYEADGDEVRDLLDLRAMIECAAAARIIRHGTGPECELLQKMAQNFEDLIDTGSIVQQHEANQAFHHQLLSMSGNPQISATIDDLRHRIPSAPAGQWKTRQRVKQSSIEHFEMVTAVRNRDAKALEDAIRRHIMQVA
ncbi:GntR family transcriptional regulator [Thalassospira mesophila]|uniref:GntR family transcriptional regulator n=1 Tax=Thalassospira mesophila TaxID=1293891 RepID=UPI001302AE5B|nr:GntR family transcriptional regulator [Thalassospira mesophila]